MTVNRRISVAPMMDWTDRHDRYFLRQISRHTLLYTEMVTTGAILHGGVDRHLRYNDAEHPVAFSLVAATRMIWRAPAKSPMTMPMMKSI